MTHLSIDPQNRFRLMVRLRRGLSLVETIVASSLMFLVLACVYWFVIASYQYFRIISDSSDRQRDMLFLLTRLNSVLQNSRPEYIYVDPSGKGVSFASPFEVNGQVNFQEDPITHQSKIVWQAYEAVYLMPDGKVRYGRLPIGAPSITIQPPDLAGAKPTDFIALGGSGDRLLCSHVSKLRIDELAVGATLPTSGTPAEKICYFLQVEVGNAADPSGYWMQLESVATPRN